MEESHTNMQPEAERYICVLSTGGIIQGIAERHSLDTAKAWVRDQIIDNGFDPETDDVRVFPLTDGNTESDLDREVIIGDEVEAWTAESDGD